VGVGDTEDKLACNAAVLLVHDVLRPGYPLQASFVRNHPSDVNWDNRKECEEREDQEDTKQHFEKP
jgi:hypothetical protein